MKFASILKVGERKWNQFLHWNSRIFLYVFSAYLLGGSILFFPHLWEKYGMLISGILFSVQFILFIVVTSHQITPFVQEYFKYLTYFLRKIFVYCSVLVLAGIAFFDTGDIGLLLKFTIFLLISLVLLCFLGKIEQVHCTKNQSFKNWVLLVSLIGGSIFVSVCSTRFIFYPLRFPLPEYMGIFFGSIFFLILYLLYTDVMQVITRGFCVLFCKNSGMRWKGIMFGLLFGISICLLGIGIFEWSQLMETRLEELEREKILASLERYPNK